MRQATLKMSETDAEFCCVLLAALLKANPGLKISHDYMAEFGSRTAVAYQHKMRSIRKRAQELVDGKSEGGAVASPAATKKRGKFVESLQVCFR